MKLTLLFILAIQMILAPAPGFSQDEYERLSVSAFEKPARPAARFAHDDHNEKAGISDDCALCHHVYENK